MDKDEMIKDLRAIIDDRCEAELGQVHAESKGGKVTKTVSTSLIAKDIYNANYRKVGDVAVQETAGTILKTIYTYVTVLARKYDIEFNDTTYSEDKGND